MAAHERTLPRFAAFKALPPGYTMVQRLAIENRQTFILLNLLSIAPFIGMALILAGVDRLLFALGIPSGSDFPMNDMTRVPLAVTAVVAVLIMLSVHELCHGLAFQALGAHPRYGVNLRKAVAYASASEYY